MRHPPAKVVAKVQAASFPNFRQHDHTRLWKVLDARKEGKGYGCISDYGN